MQLERKDKKMVNANIGHNINAAIEDLKNKQGRINLNNKIVDTYLARVLDRETDKYLPAHFKDSEVVGLRVIANRDGTKTFRFYYTPKGKGETSVTIGQYSDSTGKRFITVYVARKVARVLKSTKVLENNAELIVKKELKKYNKEKKEKIHSFNSVALEFETRIKSNRFRKKSKTNYISQLNCYVKKAPTSRGIAKMLRENSKVFKILDGPIGQIDKDSWFSIHSTVTEHRGKFAANRLIEFFRLVCNYAIEKRYIDEHFCHFKKDELNPEPKRINTIPIFNEAEQSKLDKQLVILSKINDESFVSCNAINVASRMPRRPQSEIFNLRFDQLSSDLSQAYYSQTKTDDQSTPIYEKAVPFLKKMRDWNREKFKGVGPRSNYFFPSMKFGQRLKFKRSIKKSKVPHLQRVDRTWKNALKLAKVRYRPLYMLRHSFAVKLYEETGDIELVRELLGHDAVETTLIYCKASKKRQQRRLNAIPRDFLSESIVV